MTDMYNHWLLLLREGSLAELDEELREEIHKSTPYLEAEDIDITEAEAIEAAEGYVYE
tara:strand:- start:164 stop:337 length:174 start_codon:yes stop_codon:yes gene_type:complete